MPKRLPVRPGQPRQKTHGRWVHPDGAVQEIVSGESGPDYHLARERAWSAGVAPHPWVFDGASHVEIKVASRMYDTWRQTGQPQHETIVINNRPCHRDQLDCEFVLDRFLPPGSTLTVHGPDGFERRYQGREAHP